ncbi:SRPBCC family protein [Actinomycetes bacterium KLBMP 9797]
MTARTESSVTIAAPMDLVWDKTNDVARWPQLFTEYKTAEILGQEGDTIRFRLTMHPDENGKEWSWVSERTPDPRTRTVRARRIETGPFEFMNIFWSYVEGADGVTMRWVQEFQVKQGLPFTDEQMAKHLEENSVEQMAHIKARIEEAVKS